MVGNDMIYLIGSLRNPEIPKIAAQLRTLTGQEVFDDWYAAGPEADDYWRDYEKEKGHSFREALKGYAARNVFLFDKGHLDRCRAAVLVLPAGKSGHLELGYVLGKGKPGYILLPDADPERFDVMYQFATGVYDDVNELAEALTFSADSTDYWAI
jgi:nucleoside 2-deoxyribosyltransferase